MSTPIPEVTVDQVPADAVLLDVREDDEWAAGRAPGAVHIPMGEVPARFAEVPDGEPLPVICRSGGRSLRVVAWLNAQGVETVNVEGGMKAWAAAGKPMLGEGAEPFVV